MENNEAVNDGVVEANDVVIVDDDVVEALVNDRVKQVEAVGVVYDGMNNE